MTGEINYVTAHQIVDLVPWAMLILLALVFRPALCGALGRSRRIRVRLRLPGFELLLTAWFNQQPPHRAGPKRKRAGSPPGSRHRRPRKALPYPRAYKRRFDSGRFASRGFLDAGGGI